MPRFVKYLRSPDQFPGGFSFRPSPLLPPPILPFFFPFLPTFHVHPSFRFFRPLFAPFSLLARPHSLSLSARNCLNGLLFALLPCFLLFRLAFSPNESFSRKLANCRTRFSKIDRKQGLRDWCYSRKIARDGLCWSVKRIITRNFRN